MSKLQSSIETHPAFVAGYFAVMNIFGKLRHVNGATPPDQDKRDFANEWDHYMAGFNRALIDIKGG